MEFGTRAAAAMSSPVSQAKLTQVFRVAKQDPVKKEKLPKQELVKQEQPVKKEKPAKQEQPVKKEKPAKQEQPVKKEKLAKQEPGKKLTLAVSHGFQNGSQESDPEGSSDSLLCRASNMLTQTKQSEQPDHQKEAPRPSGATMVSLPRVKKELLSPSSCLTNDSSIFLKEKEAEITASNTNQRSGTDAQSLATAHANLMCPKNARTKAPDAAASGTSLPLLTAGTLQKLPEEVPMKSLMTALVMIQESSKILDTTLDVSLVNREPVEPALEKLITALDMLKGGGAHAHVSSSPITSSGAISESRQNVAEAPSTKLMTALHMLPSKNGLLHVKSEPVDASGPLLELENFQHRIRVKQEIVINSHLQENLHNGTEEPQAAAAHVASEEPEEDCSLLSKTCAQVFRTGVEDPEEPSQDFKIRAETPVCSQFQTSNSQDFRINLQEETLISQLEKLRNGMASPSTHESTSSSDSGSTSSEDSDDADDSVISRPSNESQNSQKEIKPRNSNPGRRIQGGRVYDSAFGKTCHWCRQKTVEPHVKCRECTIHYCGPCLMNRNGENIRDELCDGVEWLCPKCRNGCGPGCENCCNCGPCRKALGKLPTGQMVSVARNAGFENAHDYLVHLETGESPRRIAQRKVGKGWINCGRFISEAVSESGDEDGEFSCEVADGEDEFTLNEETSTQLHQGKLDMKFLRRFVQSQKRKRVTMRPPLPAKRTPRPTADSLLASVVAHKQSLAEKREAIARITESKGDRNCQDVDLLIRKNQISSGVNPMAVKREYEECNLTSENGFKRRKIEGLCDASLPSSLAEVKCKIEPNTFSEESEVRLKMRGASSFNGGGAINASMECPSDPQGTDYRMKLKSVLAQPFDAEELESLDSSIRCRKPMQKLRQMRGRVVDVVTEDEGLSYLDHHQDFAAKFEEAESEPEKLALLRGFFFWLQHACMEGAFRPWPSSTAQARHRSGDCIETEGPDCQVTAVVLQLDERCNEANPHVKRKFTQRPPEPPGEIHGTHNTSRQSLMPFQAKKTFVQPAVKSKMRAQLAVAPAMNFRVVLGLPAPAFTKN